MAPVPPPPVAEVKKETPPASTAPPTPPLPVTEFPGRAKSVPKTLKLTDLLKTGQKTEEKQAAAAAEQVMNEPFTEQQLRNAWDEFAAQRKKFQAEFQMLSQPYDFRDNKYIVVSLLSPVHETMLSNIKIELTAFLRERLKNSALHVSGELSTSDDKKIIYTNRDKFDYLLGKNPMLKELKDRLGLDTDF